MNPVLKGLLIGMSLWFSILPLDLYAQCAPDKTNTTIYVSPSGNDSGAGTEVAPYRTLSYALWQVGNRKDLNCRILPNKIFIKSGDYFVNSGIYINSRISGSAEAPFVIEAEDNTNFIGSKVVTNSIKVTSGAVYNRVPLSARGALYKADLSSYGITNLGSLDGYAGCTGVGCNTVKYLDFYINGSPLSIARYPSRTDGGASNWIPVTSIPTQDGSQITYSDTTVGSRVLAAGAWVEGPMRAEWIHTYSKILSADVASKTLTLDSSTLDGGVRGPFPQSRFALLDAPEFLDSPGEYYLSPSDSSVYFIPPEGVSMSSAVLMVPFVDRTISIVNAENVIVKNINTKFAHDRNLNVYNSSNIQIIGGVFTGAGEMCVSVTDSQDVQIYGASISRCGFGGAFLTSGDIPTLTKGNITIVNSLIEKTGRWNPSYLSGISLGGIGNSAIQNTVQNIPGAGIQATGDSMMNTIQGNYVKNTVLETNDSGAIYVAGQCPYCRGTKVIQNIVDSPRGYRGDENSSNFGSVGIYADDTVNEVLIDNNIVIGAGIGILLGGGQYNTVTKNIVTLSRDSDIFIDERKRPGSWYLTSMNGGMAKERSMQDPEMYQSPLWQQYFPRLSTYNVEDPRVLGTQISNNIFSSHNPFTFRDGVGGKIISVSPEGEIRQYCDAGMPWLLCPNYGLVNNDSRTIVGVSPHIDGTYTISKTSSSSFKLQELSSVPTLSALTGFPFHHQSYLMINDNMLLEDPQLDPSFSYTQRPQVVALGIKRLSLSSIGKFSDGEFLNDGDMSLFANELNVVALTQKTNIIESGITRIDSSSLPSWMRILSNGEVLLATPQKSMENTSFTLPISIIGQFNVATLFSSVTVLPERAPHRISDVQYNDKTLTWTPIEVPFIDVGVKKAVSYVVRISDPASGNLVFEKIVTDSNMEVQDSRLAFGKTYFATVTARYPSGLEGESSSSVEFKILASIGAGRCAYLDFDCDGVTDLVKFNQTNFNFTIETGTVRSSVPGLYAGVIPGALWGAYKAGDSLTKLFVPGIGKSAHRALEPIRSNEPETVTAKKTFKNSVKNCLISGAPVELKIKKETRATKIIVDGKVHKMLNGVFKNAFCTAGDGMTSGLVVSTKSSSVYFESIKKKKSSLLPKLKGAPLTLFFIPQDRNQKELIGAIFSSNSKRETVVQVLKNKSWVKTTKLNDSVKGVLPVQDLNEGSTYIVETGAGKLYLFTNHGFDELKTFDASADPLAFGMKFLTKF